LDDINTNKTVNQHNRRHLPHRKKILRPQIERQGSISTFYKSPFIKKFKDHKPGHDKRFSKITKDAGRRNIYEGYNAN